MAQIRDPYRGDVLLLPRDRDGHEPAAALLEPGAKIALRARHGGRRDRAFGRGRDRKELQHAHPLSRTPSGSKNGPRWTRISTGLPSTTTSNEAPSTASPTGM